MASNILNVLENVEKGRQNCIKNAKLANLPATDDMDIFNIGNLFLEQNNTEFIDPNTTWVRPSDWWDTKSILENAQDIEQDGVTYHPTYIMLLPNTDISTTIQKQTTANTIASQGDAFIFSDEPDTLYVGDQTHTWDVSKDKPCSLGYKTRYIIVYMIDNTTLSSELGIRQTFKVLEVIFDKLTVPNSGNATIIFYKNPYIMNVEASENTIWKNLRTNSNAFVNCSNLQNVSIPSLTEITGGNCFENCYNLRTLNLPNCISITGSYMLANNYSLTKLELPKCTSISGYGFCSNCQNLKTLNLPLLESASNSSFCSSIGVESITLPNATIIADGFNSCKKLINLNLPKINSFAGLMNTCIKNLTIYAKTTYSLLSNTYNCEYLSLPNVQYINTSLCSDCISLFSFQFPNTLVQLGQPQQFKGCVNLKDIQLVTNWRWSLNVKDTDLTHECIIDMFNKLKDLTGEDSLTLTIGANNLAKVTDEEKLIATNKNWILA